MIRPRGKMRAVAALPVVAVLVAVSGARGDEVASPVAIRAAIARSLPLLQAGAKTFRERSEGRCIACHHQGLVLPTIALARQRGFAIDEPLEREEIDRVHGFYVRRQARYEDALRNPAASRDADAFGNFTVHAGYWLWALAAEQVPRSPALETTAALLASKQWDDGRWSFTDTARAPLQAGDFTTTALAVFSLEKYGSSEARPRDQARVALAQHWLIATTPRTTDDKAFRLFGLSWSQAAQTDIQQAVRELLADQRGDGAWGQQANMPSDAYATGLALVALHEAGQVDAATAAFRRGVQFLLQGQQADGSWFVRTRAIPTNPYFESGFPHGRSQFISYAGTCWATMALCLTFDP